VGDQGGFVALTPSAHAALLWYVEQAQRTGPFKHSIQKAIVLTEVQRQEASAILTAFWGRQFECPLLLDLRPMHGYESRILKDGFWPERYVEWLVIGCADVAEIGADYRGRPNLRVRGVEEPTTSAIFDVLVPLRSTSEGVVLVDDVIPQGLDAPKKKQPSRRSPRPSD